MQGCCLPSTGHQKIPPQALPAVRLLPNSIAAPFRMPPGVYLGALQAARDAAAVTDAARDTAARALVEQDGPTSSEAAPSSIGPSRGTGSGNDRANIATEEQSRSEEEEQREAQLLADAVAPTAQALLEPPPGNPTQKFPDSTATETAP